MCGRELEVLAIEPVRQVFDGEHERDSVPAPGERKARTRALHRESVQRQQILRDQERRFEQPDGDARDFALRAHPVLGPPPAARVREPDGAAFSDFIVSLIRNDPKGLFDLIELRIGIETMSARFAARRASRAGLQSLESAMQGMRDAAVDYNAAIASGADAGPADRRFHDFDLQFHEALATASGNRIVAFLFEAMSNSLRESFSMSRRGQTQRGSPREDTVAAHQAVLDAVRAGNERAAGEAMRKHLTDTERDIRSHFSNASA